MAQQQDVEIAAPLSDVTLATRALKRWGLTVPSQSFPYDNLAHQRPHLR